MGIVPDIQGIHHLKFPVSDLVRSVAFYETAMGARRIGEWDHVREDGSLYAVIMAVPGLGAHLELRLDARQASRQAGLDPVTLAVRDRAALAKWIVHLDASGIAHSSILVAIQAWLVVFEETPTGDGCACTPRKPTDPSSRPMRHPPGSEQIEGEPMTYPILIVGAGPTGLTAALELTRLGQPVRLVDKRDAPATTSRAIGVQARTLELLAQRGLADELIRLGNPGRFGSVYGGGKRVFHLDFAHNESRYPYILFVSQAETERVLREACAVHGVMPEWGVECVGLRQDAHAYDAPPVSATLKHGDGRLEEIAASWLIGAEGAHSLVRTTLDLPYEGHTRQERYALGDLLIDGDLPDTDFHIFSSEHGFMGLFPMGGPHFRLIASVDAERVSAPAPSLAELQAIYDERAHIPARFHDLTWSSWFTINSRMVQRLKIGRLLIGGDAAHIHSPAGAQGMNTGIQDMVNLCWKLAAVERGEAPPALLDSYEADRLPVMRAVLSRTDSLTTTIGTENRVVRTLFNHVGPWLVGTDTVQENATGSMSQVALGYRDGPLSETHGHVGTLRGGDRVPDLAVRHRTSTGWDAARLQALLDPSRATLLVLVPDGTTKPDDLTLAAGDSTVIEIAPDRAEDGTAVEQLFGRSGSAVLVRPDGYAALVSALSDAPGRVRTWRAHWATPHAAA